MFSKRTVEFKKLQEHQRAQFEALNPRMYKKQPPSSMHSIPPAGVRYSPSPNKRAADESTLLYTSD